MCMYCIICVCVSILSILSILLFCFVVKDLQGCFILADILIIFDKNLATMYNSYLRLCHNAKCLNLRLSRGGSSQLGDLGSGAGKGGGGGGSIREAGGSFGKMEAAREEEYFYKKQLEQLEKLKNDQIQQAEYHHQQIKEHEEAIQRHKTFLNNLRN